MRKESLVSLANHQLKTALFWAITQRVVTTPLLPTFQILRLTLCTTSFNIQKLGVLPTMYLCVLRGSHNKERLFLYTALTYGLYN